MTATEIHDRITWERACEWERLRFENHLLRRLVNEGRWPVKQNVKALKRLKGEILK